MKEGWGGRERENMSAASKIVRRTSLFNSLCDSARMMYVYRGRLLLNGSKHIIGQEMEDARGWGLCLMEVVRN